jgi:polysaccharide chain length determinant protein (PEP-CTERM system associated)
MDEQQGLQISDLYGLARRRGRVMSIVAAAVILGMYWIAMALPNQYTSYASILVEPQAIDEQLIAAGVRDSDLNERLGIMTAQILSRARLSKMIDKLGLFEEESKTMVRQDVIDMMRSQVGVEPILNALEAEQRNARELEFSEFKITFRSASPETAAQVAQSIANDFLDANITARVQVSQKSLDFMEESIASLGSRLEDVESQVKRVKSENTGQLPDDLQSNQRIMAALVSQIREAQRALDMATSDEAFWKNQVIAAVSMSLPNDTVSPAYRIKVIESQLANMLGRGYTDRHPDVIQARTELSHLKTTLEATSDGDAEGSGSYAEQNAKSEQRRAGLRATAAQNEIVRLREQAQVLEAQITGTPAVAEKLDQLSREYDHLNAAFQDFSARRQQAAVQANLERKQLGEQFRILENAFPAPRPSSPNRVLILAIGLMLGVGVGVAMGLVLEGADSSVHGARDLQIATNLPVLASIPAIVLEPDRVQRTRRMLRDVIAMGAVVVFCIVGGALTYFYVNGMPSILSGGPEEESDSESAGDQASRGFDVVTRGEG